MLRIDPLSKTPIYEQIIEQLERLVLSGAISPGDPIPSVRSLSMELKANPNTIQKAYSELDSRGIICSVPGKGCFISAGARLSLNDRARKSINDIKDICEMLKMAGVEENEVISAVKSVFETAKEEENK